MIPSILSFSVTQHYGPESGIQVALTEPLESIIWILKEIPRMESRIQHCRGLPQNGAICLSIHDRCDANI